MPEVAVDTLEMAKQEVIREIVTRPFLLAVIPGPSAALDALAGSIARAVLAVAELTHDDARDHTGTGVGEEADEIERSVIDKMLDYNLFADPEDVERQRVIACDLIRIVQDAEGMPV